MIEKDGRTEKATPKKREDSRKEGKVVKSKELNTLMSFIVLFICVIYLSQYAVGNFFSIMTTTFESIQLETSPKEVFIRLLTIGAPIIVVVWSLVMVFAAVNYLIQVGFLFSPKVIQPKFNNINPANYWKNIANVKKSGFELSKNLLMFVVMASIIYNIFSSNEYKIRASLFSSWSESIAVFKIILDEFVLKLGIVFLLLGVLDYFYQKYEYEQSLKMKKQEVKDEYKNTQGNPEVKSQQQMMRRRLMEKQVKKIVKDAQMVIVNPTHYAVAIRYKKKQKDAVPRVILKGVDDYALFIKEIAKENNIPIIENKPLARKIYAEIKEDEYITEELYEIIGKILAKLVSDKKVKLD